jgi:hypothetical protein
MPHSTTKSARAEWTRADPPTSRWKQGRALYQVEWGEERAEAKRSVGHEAGTLGMKLVHEVSSSFLLHMLRRTGREWL